MAVHDSKLKLKCDKCEKVLSNPGNLKIHVKAVHEKVKNHVCKMCGWKFTDPGALKRHLIAKHSDTKSHGHTNALCVQRLLN